jgi:hypothetical protein
MELIPYDEFARLRLAQFYPDASELVPLENWEFMGGVWVGEADGFTEFLRPEDRPNELGSIEIDLSAIAEDIGNAIRINSEPSPHTNELTMNQAPACNLLP